MAGMVGFLPSQQYYDDDEHYLGYFRTHCTKNF